MYLCRMAERQRREADAVKRATGGAGHDERGGTGSFDDAPLLTDRDAIRNVMGA